tara:strand:- start:767 stop:946 length:180 start_codon:yes stop_codon:yes gene_type:complete
MSKVFTVICFLFHFLVLFLGGILRVDSIKNAKALMLVNRIVLVVYATYYLYNVINYGFK